MNENDLLIFQLTEICIIMQSLFTQSYSIPGIISCQTAVIVILYVSMRVLEHAEYFWRNDPRR